MLSSLIEEGHDHVDSVGFAVHGGNNSFQILIMVVGGLIVGITVHGIGNTVIADINENKKIFSSDGFRNNSFSFSCTKTVAGGIGNIIVGYITFKGRIILCNIFNISSEINKIIIDLLAKSCSGIKYDKFKRSDRNGSLQFM